MSSKHHIFNSVLPGTLCGIPDRDGIIYNTGKNVNCKRCLKIKDNQDKSDDIESMHIYLKLGYDKNSKFNKMKKYSAFIKFKNGNGYMEFSNSLQKLKKLILVYGVVKVKIYDQKNDKKLITLTCKSKI